MPQRLQGLGSCSPCHRRRKVERSEPVSRPAGLAFAPGLQGVEHLPARGHGGRHEHALPGVVMKRLRHPRPSGQQLEPDARGEMDPLVGTGDAGVGVQPLCRARAPATESASTTIQPRLEWEAIRSLRVWFSWSYGSETGAVPAGLHVVEAKRGAPPTSVDRTATTDEYPTHYVVTDLPY